MRDRRIDVAYFMLCVIGLWGILISLEVVDQRREIDALMKTAAGFEIQIKEKSAEIEKLERYYWVEVTQSETETETLSR